jgi:hypothetical protein
VIITVAIGAMVGFLLPTIVTSFQPPVDVRYPIEESAVAREFMEAYVANNQPALARMGVDPATAARATEFATSVRQVDGLTHLGSQIVDGVALHGYAARVQMSDGTTNLLSWRVASLAGRILLLPEPRPLQVVP